MSKDEPRFCHHCGHFFDPRRFKQHLRNVVNSMARDKQHRQVLERWFHRMTEDIDESGS